MGFVEIERRRKGRVRGVEWQVYPPGRRLIGKLHSGLLAGRFNVLHHL